MILKTAPYREQIPELVKNVKRWGVDSISYFCATTGLPVATACVFVKEAFPEHAEEMDRKLEMLKEFYGYEDVI